MRRITIPVALGALLALALVGPAVAQRAVHLTNLQIAFSGVDDFLSAECGYEVTFTRTGTASATLTYNADGLIIHEVDSEPRGMNTFSGNGNTFSYPNKGVLVTSYPEGATIGAPAELIWTGFFGKLPGSLPNAGPDIITGHVVDFSAEGLPLVEFDDFLASHGLRPTDFVESLCAALDG
jgi:hypothetical protein